MCHGGLAVAAKKISTVLLIALISLALGEVALRLVDAVRPSYIFQDDSYNRFRGRPGEMVRGFALNDGGFMDLPVAPDKADRYRIVALGDSFAFGVVPYERNYLTLLEQRLDGPKRPVEVVNMGIPKISPVEERTVLLREGFALDPDLVLLSVFIGNDFLEVLGSSQQRRGPLDSSYVLSLLRFAATIGAQPDPGALYGQKTFDDRAPTMSEATYIEVVEHRARIYRTDWQRWPEALDRTVGAIAEIQSDCRRHGIPLTVVLIPDEIQVDEKVRRWVQQRSPAYRSRSIDLVRPTRELAERLRSLQIDVLDLYPDFLAAASGRRLYKPRDTHWNIAGNRLAARLIADHLLDTQIGAAPSS